MKSLNSERFPDLLGKDRMLDGHLSFLKKKEYNGTKADVRIFFSFKGSDRKGKREREKSERDRKGE